ncbi:MAG: DUF2635 domain-containing protein [Rhodospirillales bacterium]|jgi:hypothetical protein|nr:DUF2635 domain-containing protein [Rhodospirillales bacterium]
MYLKPADPKIKVRKPDGSHLAPEGEDLPDTPYWRRRLKDGDVINTRPVKAGKSKE